MKNTMTNTLKALVAQVNNATFTASSNSVPTFQDTVRIADIRDAAQDAKDTLRHRFSS